MTVVRALFSACLLAAAAPVCAEPILVYGTHSTEPAFDSDPEGGNPFASAVIAALKSPESDLRETLIDVTTANSEFLQYPDVSKLKGGETLRLGAGEKGVALVAVFSDYGDNSGLASLPGASFDANRVARALENAGYSVSVVDAADMREYLAAMERFEAHAAHADRSVLYTTGHGFETRGGDVYIISPEADRLDGAAVIDRSLAIESIARRMDGFANAFLFYAGCRDNPFNL